MLRSPHCGVLSYLFDTTELIDCKYLNIVSYPVPGDPTATALSSSSISLSWTNTSSIFGISVERRTASTEFAEIARGTAGETDYTDEGLDPETQYFYRLRYFNGLEAYHPSGEDDATTEAGAVKYGRLYNQFVVSDPRNICAVGSHIPTQSELEALITHCGGASVAGTKLREAGFIYWSDASGVIEGTNDYGFNARSSGARSSSAGSEGLFHSGPSIPWTPDSAFYLWASDSDYYGFIFYNMANFFLFPIMDATWRGYGMSLRPFKDSTTLTDGQIGYYTDPSGITYPTICIGGQEIVSQNIATRHFRSGDLVPIVTDNAAWAALETAGMCSYDNDDNNI